MKLIYKLLDFFRGNARKKPIKKPLTQKQIYNKNRDEAFDRAIRKEREIGVHPKYLNSYRRQWSPSAEEWEKLSRDWDKNNA